MRAIKSLNYIYHRHIGHRCLAAAVPVLCLATVACADVKSPLATRTVASADDRAHAAPQIDRDRIERLVAELGSDRYVDRRKAQQDLRRFGVDAFDQLHVATGHVDPEIASTAQYLLQQIPIPWRGPDDPHQVQQIMEQFGGLPLEARLERVVMLSQLSRRRGLAALARVVRFDTSELVSRTAAVAVLRPRKSTDDAESQTPAIIRRELEQSARPGAQWLQLYAAQLRDPAATVARWEQVVDRQERELADRPSPAAQQANLADRITVIGGGAVEVARPAGSASEATNETIVLNLMWHLLRLHDQVGQLDRATAMTERILQQNPDRFEETAIDLVRWFSDTQAWQALDAMLQKYDERLADTLHLQYVAAIASRERGSSDLAEKLASRALASQSTDFDLRVRIARAVLQQQGEYDWAEHEFRRAIDAQHLGADTALLARRWLIAMLHDLERNDQAAQELGVLEEALESDAAFRKRYKQAQRDYLKRNVADLLVPQQIAARRQYFLACHARQQVDVEAQRQHLQQSISLDGSDADVLIAMYHVSPADDEWTQDVRRRIAALSTKYQRTIDAAPQESAGYNQWAWLISNTEGDYEKAVRYSHRSLQLLQRPAAAYLDTLGRCYYAAGDLENAIKYQRQAIGLDPAMQVMQRQLAMFEEALAEQQKAAAEDPT